MCNKKFNSDDMKLYSNKKYCPQCYEIKILNNQQYEDLKAYCSEIFNLEYPTGLILKQIKDYTDPDTFNFKYSGIKYTIWYHINVLHKDLVLKWGLKFVEFEYEEAKQYRKEEVERINKFNQFNQSSTMVVKLKSSQINNKDSSDDILINIDSLLDGGNE